jgi:precorrin-4 methylase
VRCDNVASFSKLLFLLPLSHQSCDVIFYAGEVVVKECMKNCLKVKCYIYGDFAFLSTVKYIISIKDSKGSMLVSAHAFTVYAERRI